MTREIPPTRRLTITQKLEWQTEQSIHKFLVNVGVHPRTGKIIEVFYADGQRSGSQLRHSVEDAAVLISLLLQHGVSPTDISKSLATVPVFGTDQPATPIGVIAEFLKDLESSLAKKDSEKEPPPS